MTASARAGLLVVILFHGVTVAPQALPDEVVYARFTKAYRSLELQELKSLGEELAAGGDQWSQELSILAQACHAYRADDIRGCMAALATLDPITPPPHPVIRSWGHRIRALVYKRMGEPDQAETEIREAIALLGGTAHMIEYTDALVVLAEVLRKKAEYGASLEVLIRAGDLVDSLGHMPGICNVLINRGNLLYEQDRYPEALSMYRRVLECTVEGDLGVLANNAAVNMGSVFQVTGERDKAIHLYDSLYHALGEGHLQLRALLRMNQALAHAGKGEYIRALVLYDEALPMCDAAGDRSGRMKVLQLRSTSEWAIGQRDKALRSLLASMELARKIGRRDEVSRSLSKLAGWYEELGDRANALQTLRTHIALSDSLTEQRFSDRMAMLEVKHETDKKERLLQLRVAELDRERAIAENRSLQRDLLLGALAFLLVAGFLFFRNLRQRQTLALQEKELSEKRIEEILRSQELRLISAMAAAQEQERERIARELHDRVGSMLSAIKFQFSTLESMVAGLRIEQQQSYEKVMGMIDEAVGVVRRISHDMVRGDLAEFGLEQALHDLRDSIAVKGKLEVELSLFGLDMRMDRKVEIAAYRITQELVSNALKHGRPTDLSISFTRAPDRLSIIVEDNGAGFDTTRSSAGMGLGNVRSRISTLNGEISIDSAPGRGTTVSVEIPLMG